MAEEEDKALIDYACAASLLQGVSRGRRIAFLMIKVKSVFYFKKDLMI